MCASRIERWQRYARRVANDNKWETIEIDIRLVIDIVI